MTLTLERPAAVHRRPRGWRGPTEARPFPSLGWQVLDWTYAYLPSPADETKPLVYTNEQARRIVRWYEIDPVDGTFPWLRLVLEEAKGYGKSPFAGSLDIIDFAGPVCFDGWDANGEPVGVPWGTADRPSPWGQIAAVSEDQPLALDTVVPTPTGWTTIGDLGIGDQVLGSDGRPIEVARETRVLTGLDCYAVTFSDGERIVASASHSWTLERRNGHGDGVDTVTVSTEQLAKDYRTKRGRRYRVAATPFDLPPVDLPVDPYVLGLWLGDGAAADSMIATDVRDHDEVEAVLAATIGERERLVWGYGPGNQSTVRIRNLTRAEAIPSLRERLRLIGVLGSKHIPPTYLRSALPQRQALLQGLIDSDGHVTKKGRVSFTNINERLAYDVGELLTSLGYVWTSRFDGYAHRLFFGPADTRPVARLTRKASAQRLGGRRTTSVHRYVTIVEHVESVAVRCIGIDTVDHLFMVGRRAIPTHNTENTYGALYSMLAANDGKAADELRIDLGRTRLYLRDRPGRLEPVTASAGSREGQRLTKATADETNLWTPRNGGIRLIKTLRRNVAKMGGRTVETANAPILGERSVAEQSDPDHPDSGVLHYARRPKAMPNPDWTDAQFMGALREVYDDAFWAPLDRFVREIRDPATPWEDALQYWFNLRTSGAGRAVDPRLWDGQKRDTEVPAKTRIGAGFDGSISQDATVIRGCTADGHGFTIESWERPTGVELQRWLDAHPGEIDWSVTRSEVHQAIATMFATYSVGLMLCDTPKWYTEIEGWARLYGVEVVLAFDTNQARKFAPAVDRWLTGLREGTHTHDDDPLVDRHVKAAHLRKVRLADQEEDGRTRYVLVKGDDMGRIDGAVADVLAYEAAMTMPEPEAQVGPPLFAHR